MAEVLEWRIRWVGGALGGREGVKVGPVVVAGFDGSVEARLLFMVAFAIDDARGATGGRRTSHPAALPRIATVGRRRGMPGRADQ
jgi:hypothetical protein